MVFLARLFIPCSAAVEMFYLSLCGPNLFDLRPVLLLWHACRNCLLGIFFGGLLCFICLLAGSFLCA